MPKFDVVGFLELCQRERVTHTMLVPVQYRRIMDHPEFDRFDLTSMQVKQSTSAHFDPDLKRDVTDHQRFAVTAADVGDIECIVGFGHACAPAGCVCPA